jgi:holliday junction DNA helicase RuvA
MIYYIQGRIVERHPTFVIMEANGLGYQVYISLNTFSQLEGHNDIRLLTHFIVKEDAHSLYGFFSELERQLFILLISVSGVGPNTARLILSSLDPDSIQSAISLKDDLVFRKIKGVGPKTAQRIIIDLYDKIGKDVHSTGTVLGLNQAPSRKSEVLSALLALGFGRSAIDQVLKNLPEASKTEIPVEDLIKLALKKLTG